MNNLTKEKKQQLALVAIITVVVLIGLYVGFVSAQQKARVAAQKEADALTQKIAKANEMLKRKDAIAALLEQNRQKLAASESTMPTTATAYQWLVGIVNSDKYLYRPGTSLTGFNTSVGTVGNVALFPKFPYRAVTYNVSLSGYYDDFGRFLADFENDWPNLRIQNVTLSAPAVPGECKLDIRFDIVSLVLTNNSGGTITR